MLPAIGERAAYSPFVRKTLVRQLPHFAIAANDRNAGCDRSIDDQPLVSAMGRKRRNPTYIESYDWCQNPSAVTQNVTQAPKRAHTRPSEV